jgi:hypothetical protein
VALPIDTTRPVRSRADQQALVKAVYEAEPDAQETYWLEWKGPLTLTRRDATGRATIAKAVLGFANREPSAAARTMGGCAYLLAGVSPGELSGVAAVDAAQLEAQVATYVGGNVDWRADYVTLEDKQVLVVTVEPPQWGDPAHPVRKTFNPSDRRGPVLQEGTVFVRHQASTDPATAADVDMLSRRAARRPGDELEVDVQLAPETKLRAIDVNERVVENFVRQEQSMLLASLSSAGRRLPGFSPFKEQLIYGAAGLGGLSGRERRSEEDYREEVAGYLDELREQLPGILPARAVMHGVARLRLTVVNNSDATFTKVQVEAKLPADVWVTEWRYEMEDQAEPPKAPTPYGQARLSRLGYSGISMSSLINPGGPVTPWRPDVDRRSDAVYVEYLPEDVRARGVTPLPSLWLVIGDPSRRSIEVRWEATATNAQRRLSGTLSVPVDEPPVAVEELMAELPKDED